MILKKIMLAYLLVCSLTAFSQTVNYAISNDGTGFVETSVIHELDGSAEATVQM